MSAESVASHLEAEPNVLSDREMRVERVGLEHHRDVAVARRGIVGESAIDQQPPGGRVVESGHDPQRGRLAAARGPDQDQELPLGDVKVEVRQGGLAVVVAFRDLLEGDRRQCRLASGARLGGSGGATLRQDAQVALGHGLSVDAYGTTRSCHASARRLWLAQDGAMTADRIGSCARLCWIRRAVDRRGSGGPGDGLDVGARRYRGRRD